MKAAIPNPTLTGVTISATVSTGFKMTDAQGQSAQLAIIDDKGNILAAGQDVAWAAWRVCVEVQENFWEGQGHLVVLSSPPSQGNNKTRAA